MDTKIARWIGRGLCTALFILWGMFFVEHLNEFTSPGVEQPPFWAWLLQFVHGLLLISYLICWKYEKIGSLGILIFASIFFISVGAAWYLLLISLTPILFFGYTWMRQKQAASPKVP